MNYRTSVVKLAEKPVAQADSSTKKRWYAIFFSPFWICLLIALLLRIWLVVRTQAFIDGDEVLVGIQAERILRGEFPIYFYGQPYMGSLEVYFIAIIFALLGPSAWTLRIEPILLSLVVVWLTWELAAALADVAQLPLYARRLFMTSAALLAAVPPLYDAIIEVRTYGGYIETFVLMLLLLLSVVHLTRRWFAGASRTELAWRWAGIGFLVGLGFWIYPLIAVAILASAIWIIGSLLLEIIKLCRLKPAGTERTLSTILHPAKDLWLAVAAGPAATVGFTPGIIWGATHNWTNIAYIVGLGGQDSISHHLRTINHVTQAYISCVAPRIISGSLPTAGGILTTLHWPLLYIGTFFIFATVALIAVSFLWQQPLLMQFRRLAALPTIFAGCWAIHLFSRRITVLLVQIRCRSSIPV